MRDRKSSFLFQLLFMVVYLSCRLPNQHQNHSDLQYQTHFHVVHKVVKIIDQLPKPKEQPLN